MGSRPELDGLARDLATGEISRRAALGRLIGGAVAVGVASLPGAEALASRRRCPSARKCGDKCCPAHSKCKRGRCKCNDGYTKCGKKCVDLQTSVKHCGDCGWACEEGASCVGGQCQACGNGIREGSEACDGDDLGGQTCVTQGYGGGTLACSNDCQSFDYSDCCDPYCPPGYCGDDGCGGACQCAPGEICDLELDICTTR